MQKQRKTKPKAKPKSAKTKVGAVIIPDASKILKTIEDNIKKERQKKKKKKHELICGECFVKGCLIGPMIKAK